MSISYLAGIYRVHVPPLRSTTIDMAQVVTFQEIYDLRNEEELLYRILMDARWLMREVPCNEHEQPVAMEFKRLRNKLQWYFFYFSIDDVSFIAYW